MSAQGDILLDRIGLLFVHGIGEQKRFEHLKNSAREFAELLQQSHDEAVVTVTDRTEDWPHPAGTPASYNIAPLTIAFRSRETGDRQIHFECHEVWWADLGTRSGLWDIVTFWLWGLGQWAAPMYREIDASGVPKDTTARRRDDPKLRKPVPRLTRLPKQLAGLLLDETWTRIRLGLAGFAAALVVASWMLAKRAFQALLGQSPSPVLLVRYVGDVRTYEARWVPGDANLSDPGHPRRVAIRRRMISEMVAMGARAHRGGLDGWFVCAHSLGTIVAYNGLTEISHALPNYLSREQWQALPATLKRDDGCELRGEDDLHKMMPSRPDWLDPEDLINRPALFAKLRGILTYGSPLDKFAALWPRIVATATDRKDGRKPFPDDCDWINFSAPEDPVSGTIDAYNSYGVVDTLDGATPEVINLVAPVGPAFGLAHITYFSGTASGDSLRERQRRGIMRWLTQPVGANLDPDLEPGTGVLTRRQSAWTIVSALVAGYAVILSLLPLATGALWWAVFKVGDSLLTEKSMTWPTGEDLVGSTALVLGLAWSIVVFFGLLRWLRESHFNRLEAERERANAIMELDAAKSASPPNVEEIDEIVLRETLWRWIGHMYTEQNRAAWTFLIVLFLPALLLLNPLTGLASLWIYQIHGKGCWIDALNAGLRGIPWSVVMLLLFGAASFTQARINMLVPTTANTPSG